MKEARIIIHESPISARTSILAPARANRGGLIESIERAIEEAAYFDIDSYGCDTIKFQGLPYIDKPCEFKPGNEAATTREYARVDSIGKLLVHPKFIFPGEDGWLGDGWHQRVIDNKRPLTDRKDFFSGFVYRNHRENDDMVDRIEAKGKDLVIIVDSHHIVPVYRIDFESLARLEQIFTVRELEDPDIQYICVGSNNPGLPRKIQIPFKGNLDLESLTEAIRATGLVHLEESLKTLEVLKTYSRGYYEPAGISSGTSQPHPHKRIISLPILPKWIEEGYRRTELKASQNGRLSFYDFLKREGYVIIKGKYFSLAADPVPEFNGGLIVIARDRHNITQMSMEELRELAYLRRLGRVMQEILYNGAPSNDYMIQTFRPNIDKYPNTRYTLSMVPRKNVQAFLELSTKIVGLDTDARQLAETMTTIGEYVIKRIS